MFNSQGNYFLSISFEWKKIFEILGVTESEQQNFVVNEKYQYVSPNANESEGLGINNKYAIFEYYIIPNSLKSGSYSYSSIYDQQLKRFFESPNINYGPVLINSKKENSSIICLFNKNVVNNKAGFSIYFSNEENWKVINFLFDETYLNLKDAKNKWGDEIPFDSFEISQSNDGDNIVKKILVSPETLSINTGVQSQDDAQSSPFAQDLYSYFKKI